MYYKVKLLGKEPVRFPDKSEFDAFNAQLTLLFEDAGDETYDLIEKYVSEAFEYENTEEFIQNLQTFARRANKNEIIYLLEKLTEGNITKFSDCPAQLDKEFIEKARVYWFLNNIFSDVRSDIVKNIDAIKYKFELIGNDEDALLTSDDTATYGEIYPFATRLFMDATNSNGKIGSYQLKGPLVDYFEQLKSTGLNHLSSSATYDFDEFVDDTAGIIWTAKVTQEPEEDENGQEKAVYEFIIHSSWLHGEVKTEFNTFPYSDYI